MARRRSKPRFDAIGVLSQTLKTVYGPTLDSRYGVYGQWTRPVTARLQIELNLNEGEWKVLMALARALGHASPIDTLQWLFGTIMHTLAKATRKKRGR